MTTTTVSEALAAATAGGNPPGNAPEAIQREAVQPGRRAGARARDYRSLPVVGKLAGWVAGWALQAWADLRSAWWTPQSLPTVRRAWSERIPDRGRVPGDNPLLYGGWLVYNHTVALVVPLAATVVVGALTPLVWAARHPARLALLSLAATASIVLTIN